MATQARDPDPDPSPDGGAGLFPMLRATDIAKALNVKKDLVYELMRKGEIPTIRVSTNTVRVLRADFEAWVERQRRSA